MMKKGKGKMKSEKVRMSLLFTFSLLLFTSAALAALAAGDPFADGIAELLKGKDVTGLDGIMATLPDLENVNGLTLDELASAGMLGAVKATGFSASAVKDCEAKLDVVVSRSDSLGESAEWKPVSTNTLPVPSPGEQGFFIVAPQGK